MSEKGEDTAVWLWGVDANPSVVGSHGGRIVDRRGGTARQGAAAVEVWGGGTVDRGSPREGVEGG